MGITNYLKKIKGHLKWIFWNHFDMLYRLYVYYKGERIKKKEHIKVLFVLAELSTWKTEELYAEMTKHPRFEPVLGITSSKEVPGSKKPLINFINQQGYSYIDLDQSEKLINKINPDIIIYYKPYDGSYPKEHIFKKHLKSLPIYINYTFNIIGKPVHISHQICNYSLYVFVENELVKDCIKNFIGKRRSNNIRITGIPMQDVFFQPKLSFKDPWHDKSKKRIIYAPHHSIKGTNGKGLEFATFLDFGYFIFEMAEKYKDYVYFAFKPHPNLYPKLVSIWGKERADDYYDKWNSLENGQYSPGDYVGLFMNSDAMIHDCGSFQLEYHYTGNPAMFLESENFSMEDLNDFGKMAHNIHYIGKTKQDIEQFIINVIEGKDSRKNERIKFYQKYLLPPNGKKASQNIIDTILGIC